MVGCDPAVSIATTCVFDALCEGLVRATFPQACSVSSDTPTHSCSIAMQAKLCRVEGACIYSSDPRVAAMLSAKHDMPLYQHIHHVEESVGAAVMQY